MQGSNSNNVLYSYIQYALRVLYYLGFYFVHWWWWWGAIWQIFCLHIRPAFVETNNTEITILLHLLYVLA